MNRKFLIFKDFYSIEEKKEKLVQILVNLFGLLWSNTLVVFRKEKFL